MKIVGKTIGHLQYTPERHWPITLFAFLLVMTQPIFSGAHYFWNEKAGAYPVNADSIGIPIANEVMAWMMLAPIALIGAEWAIWKYPGTVSLDAWNGNRPFWSVLWSMAFFLLWLMVLLDIPFNLRWLNLPSLLNDVLWLLLLCQLRALVVAKKGWV